MFQIYKENGVERNLSTCIVALSNSCILQTMFVNWLFSKWNRIFLLDLHENFRDALAVLFVSDF